MIESAAALYVHAIAIEREAAERYTEFAARMADQGNAQVAAIFGKLAGFEAGHLEALKRRTAGVALPDLQTLSNELEMLECTADERRPESRLSCQIRLTADLQGLVVRLPERQQ